MRIVSKFLTADARITTLSYRDRTLVMEALVKEFMPMTVEMGADDFRQLGRLLAGPLVARLERFLPRFVATALAQRVGPASGTGQAVT